MDEQKSGVVDYKVRLATRKDFLDFYGRLPPQTTRAKVWEVDGEPVAIVGWTIATGVPMVYSDVVEGLEVPKMTIWREAKKIMQEIPDSVCYSKGNSGEFLKRLGWTETEIEGMYEWRS